MAVERRSTMLAVLLICAGLLQTSSAVEHTVGGSTPWSLTGSTTTFDDWAKGETFVVGDTLRFTWTSAHDVWQVTPADAQACNLAATTIQTWTTSPAVVTLDSAGDFGFLCSIGSHCTQGMKMTVTVIGATPPTTTPGASPPPPPMSNAPPLNATTPPSPQNSSASSFSCNSLVVATLALVAALATLIV